MDPFARLDASAASIGIAHAIDCTLLADRIAEAAGLNFAPELFLHLGPYFDEPVRRIAGTAYGPQPIREPRATLPEALGQTLKAAAYRVLPIASRAALQTPRKGSAIIITYPEQVVGIRPVSTKTSDAPDWQAAADKREIAEWERALRAQNVDRARRGLPPLQPPRPFNPTGRYWMGQ
jgi:hypothetical protein